MFFIVATSQRQAAEELECIFANLVNNYGDIGLKSCNPDSRSRRHADGPKPVRRLALFHPYIPELANLSLASHSLCSRHYMQIVINNHFYELLSGSYPDQESDEDQEESQENKRARLDTNQDYPTAGYANLTFELDKTKEFLELAQLENEQKSQLIVELKARIERM